MTGFNVWLKPVALSLPSEQALKAQTPEMNKPLCGR